MIKSFITFLLALQAVVSRFVDPKCLGNDCFDKTQILNPNDVPEKLIKGNTEFTQGNLFGAHVLFDDQPLATGNITQVVMYTGNFNGRQDVVVGVQFSYGGSQARLHGRVAKHSTTCDIETGEGEYLTTVEGTALNDGGAAGGRVSMIYSLTIKTNLGDCHAGNTASGRFFSLSTGYPLHYIYGRTTQPQPQMLGSLTFVFWNKETCPDCCGCDESVVSFEV